jgi:hypothetical protein
VEGRKIKAALPPLVGLETALEKLKPILKPDLSEVLDGSLDAVREALPLLLWDILNLLLTDARGAFRIYGTSITLTLPDGRIPQIARQVKANLYLDATSLPKVLATRLDIPVSELLVCKLDQPKGRNLRHIQVSGFGKCGRDRAKSTNDRLQKVHSGILANAAERLPEGKFDWAIADFKGNQFDSQIEHLVNSRGSNAIAGYQVLIQHGLPKINLGAVQDEYDCLRSPDFTFEQYYQQRCDEAFLQGAGRLRADRYPDKDFLIYWIAEEPLPFEAEQVRAADLNPEADLASVRLWRKIDQQVRQALKADGKFPLQESVAIWFDCSAAWISQLAERFAGGWRNFKKVALSLLAPPAPDKTDLTEAEAEVKQAVVTALKRRPAEFVEIFTTIVGAVGWSSWLRIVSRLDRLLRLEILDQILEVFV